MWVLILILHLSNPSVSDKNRQIRLDGVVVGMGPYKSLSDCEKAEAKALDLHQVTSADGRACVQLDSAFPTAFLPR